MRNYSASWTSEVQHTCKKVRAKEKHFAFLKGFHAYDEREKHPQIVGIGLILSRKIIALFFPNT
jgi:hypothetical protein